MFCLVNITVPDRQIAEKLAKKLIDERLVACVSIVPGIKSIYRWQGKIESEQELLLVAKTHKSLFDELSLKAKELHPYEVPEIVASEIVAVDKDYANWLEESLKI